MTALSLLFQDPAFAATAPARVRAAVGAVMLIGVAWGLSSSRDRVSWRLVGWGLGLQLAFAFLVLQTPF
ncbi:MAG: hypothetical protein HN396_00005, partial [Gemmatimonadales bacterium]|nr:hypothetical protein [Gemmatimonadales bacterium]